MKRILFTLLCFLSAWSMMAQARYVIKSVGGDVEYKSSSSYQWQAVRQDLVLTSVDSIRIQQGGYVSIMYGSHSYPFTMPCKAIPVADLVQKKQTDLAKHFSAKGVLREIGGDKQKSFGMAQVGVGGARGANKKKVDYEELANQLAWIGAQACSGAKSPTLNGIVFKRHKLSGGELDFEFENRTDKDYHINVLHVNKSTHTVSLCYVITPEVEKYACPITPSGFCSCAMDVYFPDTKDDVYVLVAIEHPYDSYTLDNELLYHRTDKAKKTDTDIQYMWNYEK